MDLKIICEPLLQQDSASTRGGSVFVPRPHDQASGARGVSEDDRSPGSLRSHGTWGTLQPGSRMLPPSVLLQRVLLHKPAGAVRALKRSLPRVNPAVLGQLARLAETARAERTAMGPPTTGPVNGVMPCQVTSPLECLPADVTLEGLHLRVGDAVSLEIRHVLEDPGAHRAAVALFLR